MKWLILILFLVMMPISYSLLNESLISCYPLDVNASDLKNYNNGYLFGNTFIDGSDKKIGNGSVFFDGDQDFIVANETIFNLLGSNFSVEYWINGSSFSAYSRYFTYYYNSTDYFVITTGSLVNVITPYMKIQNTEYGGQTSEVLSSIDWDHVVIRVDFAKKDFEIWVNGANKTYGPASGFGIGTYKGIIMGIRNDLANSDFNGNLDEVKIWNRYLTSAEITELYNSGNGVNCSYVINASIEGCTESLINTSWSAYVNLSECYINDTVLQVANLTQWDENRCGGSNTTFFNYTFDECITYPYFTTYPFNVTQTNQSITINTTYSENCNASIYYGLCPLYGTWLYNFSSFVISIQETITNLSNGSWYCFNYTSFCDENSNCNTTGYFFNFTTLNTTISNITTVGYYSITLINGTKWFNFDDFDATSTHGMLLFFLVLLILIGFVVLSEILRIPAFIVLTGLSGLFFSFFVYVLLSAILGFVFFALSVMYVIRAFYDI